jgi:DNA-binding GntR family transcriptional regulator
MRACLNNFDPTRFTELNHEFHAVFFEHCSNLHILDLVHRGWNRLATIRESSFGYIPGRAQESVEEHDNLVNLIASGADALTIEMAARAHRLATLNAYLESKNTASSTRSP